jgi:hypothetical protein
VVTPLHDHFNALFSSDPDPWQYRSSWPEKRRLDLLVAILPHERYGSVFEPACASGSLTARLCSRAEVVVAWDASSEAIGHARRLLEADRNVTLECKRVPDDWPEIPMDLVVLSDFLYYLQKDDVATVALLAAQTVSPTGTIVGCHWRGSAHDFSQAGGDAVHSLLAQVLGPPAISYLDERHVIDVWTR